MRPVRLYHYTHPGHLASIIEEGSIRTTDSNLGMTAWIPPNVVWLTDEAVLLDEGTRDGLYSAKREVRFEVEALRAKRWLEWAPAQNMDPEWRDIIIRSGGGMEAAEHWFVSTRPIPRADWRSVIHVPSQTLLDFTNVPSRS